MTVENDVVVFEMELEKIDKHGVGGTEHGDFKRNTIHVFLFIERISVQKIIFETMEKN